jgi:hypothetical protein
LYKGKVGASVKVNADINSFIKFRENIETLIVDTKKWVKQKSINESSIRLDKLRKLLFDLNNMAANDVQKKAVLRLKQDIDFLDIQVENIYSKRESGKKQDGNIAFKCNWNDKYYRAPCSEAAYNSNLIEGRAWCSHKLSKCRTYTHEVTLDNNPCYESIALKEMFFGAGWDINGDKIKYRQIHSVKSNRLAILTTRRPYTDEKDRMIVGILYINQVKDDDNTETKIFGDKEKSIAIDYDKINIRFWDYYKNPNAEDSIFWGTGLFRYISNGTVLSMLQDINKIFNDIGMDTTIINKLLIHYEQLNAS